MAAKPIPEGYRTVTPYLCIDGAERAIAFYKEAFGAEQRGIMHGPDGKVAHAEVVVGDSVVMLSDPFPQGSTKPPTELGGSSASLMMYVEDVDAAVQRALDAGASLEMEIADMFWGDRFGAVSDPFGHTWSIATHVEDVPPEEMAKRAEAAMSAMSG
jgi:PhnB protein